MSVSVPEATRRQGITPAPATEALDYGTADAIIDGLIKKLRGQGSALLENEVNTMPEGSIIDVATQIQSRRIEANRQAAYSAVLATITEILQRRTFDMKKLGERMIDHHEQEELLVEVFGTLIRIYEEKIRQ